MAVIRNWSGSVRFTPQHLAKPSTEEELRNIITQAHSLRVMGAGHSFTPLIETEETLLSLDSLSGLIAVDRATNEVTLWGGTRLRDIAGLLAPWGLALPNMGDIDAQSIAGAVSTGTHGTGLAFTGYSGLVTGLRLVLADGQVVDCDAHQKPELFEAARVGLGLIGVISAVRLRCVPAFNLSAQETTEPVERVLSDFLDRSREIDHVEFFWFPDTKQVTVKQNRRLPLDAPTKPMTKVKNLVNREILGNYIFGAADALAWRIPRLASPVREIASRVMAGDEFSDASHRVFVAPRRVRFNEAEYAVPLEAFPTVLQDVERAIVNSRQEVTFPIEVRTAAADDTWLGPASGRESLYIAVHRYWREDFDALLRAVEPVFAAYGGRPHWGKRHNLTATQLSQLYPRFADFQRVRAAADPDGKLLNRYTAELVDHK